MCVWSNFDLSSYRLNTTIKWLWHHPTPFYSLAIQGWWGIVVTPQSGWEGGMDTQVGECDNLPCRWRRILKSNFFILKHCFIRKLEGTADLFNWRSFIWILRAGPHLIHSFSSSPSIHNSPSLQAVCSLFVAPPSLPSKINFLLISTWGSYLLQLPLSTRNAVKS